MDCINFEVKFEGYFVSDYLMDISDVELLMFLVKVFSVVL